MLLALDCWLLIDAVVDERLFRFVVDFAGIERKERENESYERLWLRNAKLLLLSTRFNESDDNAELRASYLIALMSPFASLFANGFLQHSTSRLYVLWLMGWMLSW